MYTVGPIFEHMALSGQLVSVLRESYHNDIHVLCVLVATP